MSPQRNNYPLAMVNSEMDLALLLVQELYLVFICILYCLHWVGVAKSYHPNTFLMLINVLILRLMFNRICWVGLVNNI